MIQVETVGKDRVRFATKGASSIEVMLMDGKMFVHSEPLKAKTPSTTQTVAGEKFEKASEPIKEAKTS